MKDYGLVLGGGGAKGGYEIGAWKALKELGVELSAVAGTSVGALNGAMIVQDDIELALKLWADLTIGSVIKVEKEVAVVEESRKPYQWMIDTIRGAMNSGGLDVTPLKMLLEEIVDENRIRHSNMDFGMVTFSLTDFKPVKIFKKDIPHGKLIDYMLASACFPAFKPHEIDSKRFIDGGVYDNIPVSLLVEKGIKNIIAVDVSGLGRVRKVDGKGLNIINIRNSEDLGGTLNFDGQRSKRNIEIGYYDTLKVFGKFKGKNYYIIGDKESKGFRNEYIKQFGIEDIKRMYDYLGMKWGVSASQRDKLAMYKIMRTIKQYCSDKLNIDSILPAMAEITAEQIGIERVSAYTLWEITDKILKRYEAIRTDKDFDEYIKSLKDLFQSKNQFEFDKEIKKVLIEGKFLVYFNPNINEDDDRIKRFRRFIAMAFPKISIANMFIALVSSKSK